MSVEPGELRRKMARFARNKRFRRNDFSHDLPAEWRPWEVPSPATGMPFTDREAWIFIAELLERDYPWEEVILEKPPGCKAYVMTVATPGCKTLLYIKVHLLRDCVYGRSFHLSER
jgi:hypothetical protein